MRTEICTPSVLSTTSARYEISAATGTITVFQMIDFPRILATWHLSPSSLVGLSVRHSSDRCVLANSKVTVGVQSDGLLGIVPHTLTNLTITSECAIHLTALLRTAGSLSWPTFRLRNEVQK